MISRPAFVLDSVNKILKQRGRRALQEKFVEFRPSRVVEGSGRYKAFLDIYYRDGYFGELVVDVNEKTKYTNFKLIRLV
jgi:hypothetical protein